MRAQLLFTFLLLLAVFVFAQGPECSDTDGGKDENALSRRGDVRYGITTQTDVCLTSREGVSVNKSNWLKEYFCEGNPLQRQSRVFDCTREGFIGCENGACISIGGSGGANVTVVPKPVVPVNACGNERLEKDKGEECDPPGAICFGKTSKQYGQCESNCKCKIAQSAEKAASECGDGSREYNEVCEEDADCPANHVCSSCNCVKQLTPEEIAAMGGTPAETPKADEPQTNNDKPAIDMTPKNFSESPAIKATSGIAGFFRKVFGWLGSIFS